MARFRKKQLEVTAEQWFPGKSVEGVFEKAVIGMPYGVAESVLNGLNPAVPKCGAVQTGKGWMIVMPGDWLVTGLADEKHVYSDELFRLHFERVETE
jgi:hypothetical protein